MKISIIRRIAGMSILSALALTSFSSNAACRNYVDPFGNRMVDCDDGQKSQTRRDSRGNTTGTANGEKVNLYTDRYGNTTGTIGDKNVSVYRDRYGNTTGTVGTVGASKPAHDADYSQMLNDLNRGELCMDDGMGGRFCSPK